MAYTYGIDNIKKNNYEIYIRAQKTAETVDENYKLKALLFDLSSTVALDESATHASITAVNTIYTFDTTGAIDDTTIDMSDVAALVGTTNHDVLVFKLITQEAGFNVIIKEDDATIYTLNAEDEWLILCDPDQAGFDFYAWGNTDGVQSSEYTKIGGCDEKPTIKTSQGAGVMINSGDEITISENLEVAFNDLQVTVNNYSFLKDFSYIDLMFYNSQHLPGTIMVYNILMQSFLEATANDLNKTIVNIKLETSDVDDHLNIYKESV